MNKLMGTIKRIGTRRKLATVLAGLMFFSVQAVQALPIINDKIIDIAPPDFARGSAPSEIFIWDNILVENSYLGVESTDGRGGFVCKSDVDPRFGACATTLIWWSGTQESTIKLLFTEKRSHKSITLDLIGWDDTPCIKMSINSASLCMGYGTSLPSQTFNISLSGEQLNRLPSGGIWQATLVLKPTAWDNKYSAALWTANITLNVTDDAHADIFFPGYGTPNPTVNLNLSTHPADNRPVTGGAHVDLCLYDGYNSNSSWLSVKVTDPQHGQGLTPDVFSITRSTATQPGNNERLDYNVMLNYNGTSQKMDSGQEVRLTGTDKAPVRQVMLPGILGTVLCSPASLDLTVVPFSRFDKQAGSYSGTLRLTLNATTQTP